MMLTSKARYAIIAIIDIVKFANDKPTTLLDIQKRQNITISYLEQIFNKLKSAGIVKSVRGPGGGYLIEKDIKDIKVKHIIDAVEENIKMTGCAKSKSSGCVVKSSKCLAHDFFDSISNKISEYFIEVSLFDVVNGNYDSSYKKDVGLV